jgi:pimeloyl-ACP methyl ester carboxylesterase
MGAAITLNFALRRPERVLGLVQSRPAWLEGPRLENVELFALVAQHIRDYGVKKGRERFLATPQYLQMAEESPGTALSLIAQFDSPKAAERVARLERILADRPSDGLEPLREIQAPALVLANRQDAIHPFEYGEVLARTIPGAEFRELTPRAADPVRHTQEVREHLSEFLRNHFLR